MIKSLGFEKEIGISIPNCMGITYNYIQELHNVLIKNGDSLSSSTEFLNHAVWDRIFLTSSFINLYFILYKS